jgi:hypothetical protein
MINKVCHLSERDAAFRERLREDPDEALKEFKLDPEERRALQEGDVVTLYRKGGHAFLMQHLARHGLFGLNVPLYRQRITSIADE